MKTIGYAGKEVSNPFGTWIPRRVGVVAVALLWGTGIGDGVADDHFRETISITEYSKKIPYQISKSFDNLRPKSENDGSANFYWCAKSPVDQAAVKINCSHYGKASATTGKPSIRIVYAGYSGGTHAGICARTEFECANRIRRVNGASVIYAGDFRRRAIASLGSDFRVDDTHMIVALQSSPNTRFADVGENKEPVVATLTTISAQRGSLGEPQVYTMMLAGLGLMGFVITRRQP